MTGIYSTPWGFFLTAILIRVILAILYQWVMITQWQLKDIAFWLCIPPEVWHIWGEEGEKCKIWLSSSLSYGNTAVQIIFSTELGGASPPFEAGEHCRRVALGWKAAWNTCTVWSIYTVWLLCNTLAPLFISVQCKCLYSAFRNSSCRCCNRQKLEYLWSKDPRNPVAPRSSRIKVMKVKLSTKQLLWCMLCWPGPMM